MFYLHYSYQLSLLCIFISILMIIIARPQNTFREPESNNVEKGTVLFFLLYTINSVFAFWAADTYHMWEQFKEGSLYTSFEIWGYEAIYNWLASIVNNDYFLWRACIWIPACTFYYLCAKKLNILNKNFLLALALFAGWMAYTRGMLGHTMLLFGVVLLADDNNNKFERFVGLALLCVSYFFHKSMFVNIIFALIAFAPLGKRSIKISFIAYPFLSVLASILISKIVSGDIILSLGEGVGGVGDKTVNYASLERSESNIFGIIGKIITFSPQYLALFYLVNRVVFKKYFQGIRQEKVFTYLFRLTYVAIYIASLFYFVNTSSWIYDRFKYMGLFPLPFVLAKVWSMETKSNKWIKCIIILQLLSLFFDWSMQTYHWYEL